MKNYLVTGGCGFIGSHLTKKLLDLGHKVIVFDNLSTGKIEHRDSRAVFYGDDIRTMEDLEKIPDHIDGIFHLAAVARIQPSIDDPLPTFDVNVDGTLNVLQFAKARKAKLVFASSSSVYGNGRSPNKETARTDCLNPYALSKLMGEQLLKLWSDLYGLKTTSCRFFNVYGDRMPDGGAYATCMGIFFRQKKEGKPLTITGDGDQRRDFTHVDDIVAGLLAAMDKSKGQGEVFNLGSGSNISILELAHLVGGKDIVHLPERIGESRETLADITKAKLHLDYKPVKRIDEYVRSHID